MDLALRKSLARGQLAFAKADARPHIPYAAHVDSQTLRTESGDMLCTIRLDGVPVETLAQAEIDSLMHARNQVFKSIASAHLSLWFHLVRRRETSYPQGSFPPGFARDLDARWRARRADRQFYSNELYVTVVRRGPGDSLITRNPFKRSDPAADFAARRQFEKHARVECLETAEKLRSYFSRYGARIIGLQEVDGVVYSEPLQLLRGLISGEWRPVVAPRMHLRDFLSPNYISFGMNRDNLDILERRDPAGNSAFGGMLGIKEYMPGTASTMMDLFLTAPCELVVSQSFTFASKAGTLEEMRRQRNRFISSGDAAESLAQNLDEARDDLASSRFAWGEHQFSCLVLASSLRELKDHVSYINTELNDIGLVTLRESRNLELAFWAQLPGNATYRTRHVGISTVNLAAFCSSHAFHQGRAEGNHWGPAVSALETSAGTPYFHSFHVNDVGHGIWIGPNGSGKTVAALFMLAQAQRFSPPPRTIVFDKGQGAEIAVRALGGQYTVIRQGQPTGWNPFGLPGTAAHRGFLRSFLAQLVTPPGETLGADDRVFIANAVERMYQLDEQDRRMIQLRALIPRTSGSNDLNRRFAPWYGTGEWAWLFDNETDQLALDATILGFDLTTILRDPSASGATLAYLFYQVDRQRDGRRTIIFVDEGWYALTQASFEATLRDWYKTGRKDEFVLQMATQEAGDALRSQIGQTIIQQSPTHCFFPNPQATREELIDGFKLTEREFHLVTKVLPDSRCFLVRRGNVSAVVRFDMSGMAGDLAVLSGRRERVEWLDAVRAQVGDEPAAWLPIFWQHVTGETYREANA